MERNRSDEKNPTARRTPSGAAVIQEAKTLAIEDALFEEWAVTGYAALSMEAIAKRAGVGKAALYRRWPSKLAMVSDVMTRVGTDLIATPDTGSLRADILLMLLQMRRLLRHRLVGRILPDLHAEMPRNAELAAAIRSTLQANRRRRAEEMLRRAIERGELPSALDLDLATDLLGSMIYWRVIVTRESSGRAYLSDLTALILRALGWHGQSVSEAH